MAIRAYLPHLKIAMPNAIVWFRNDLRLADNPALQAAVQGGFTPVCVHIHAPQEEGEWRPGAASDAWRHHSLAALQATLRACGSRLLIRRGPSQPALAALIRESGAEAVFWNRRYEPAIQPRDAAIKRELKGQGLQVESFNAALLFEPWSLATAQGGPYKVFTPFWRNALSQWRTPTLRQVPVSMPALPAELASEDLDTLRLRPSPCWDRRFWDTWQPGEAGAHEALDVFIEGALRGYRSNRDRPDRVGTSLLSPHLHFGEIAPWRIVAALEQVRNAGNAADMDAYLRELGWREFAYHLMHHFPHSTHANLNRRFEHFEWARTDEAQLQVWRQGRTGVPIVDAGMRELWATGTMHNRVRMIVASWLTKHLRQHWLHGARWFWDTLLDADLASNSLGWQWVAGTGADAAPYFRVFNPVTQAQKFDPEAAYISRWIPELRALPVALRFAPWTQPERAAQLAPDYPARPMVDLAHGREAALAAYRRSAPGEPR